MKSWIVLHLIFHVSHRRQAHYGPHHSQKYHQESPHRYLGRRSDDLIALFCPFPNLEEKQVGPSHISLLPLHFKPVISTGAINLHTHLRSPSNPLDPVLTSPSHLAMPLLLPMFPLVPLALDSPKRCLAPLAGGIPASLGFHLARVSDCPWPCATATALACPI